MPFRVGHPEPVPHLPTLSEPDSKPQRFHWLLAGIISS